MLNEADLLKLQNGSDVRGVALGGVEGETVNLTAEAVNRIASGFVQFLVDKLGKEPSELRIAIGHDSRISATGLKSAAIGALSAHRAEVLDCGLASTPAMFMSIIFDETKADGSIMLTASHLPFNRNGMKFFTADGGLEKSEIKTVLKNAAKAHEMTGAPRGVTHFDLIELYSKHLRGIIRRELDVEEGARPLSGMHIVTDAGNGAGGFFADKILEPLGADTSGSQFLEPDGHFPNHIPNPENAAAMEAIRAAVLDNKADLGLIFDTDVDRMSAVLSDGKTIDRNALIAMMAAILAPKYPGSTIVTDSVTSDGLKVFLEGELGLKHHRFKRGYKNVINECIRLNESGVVSPLAIETSGHGALSENYYLDDGAYLAVKLLIAAARARREGKDLSTLIEKLTYPLESREYRLKIVGTEEFKDYGARVLEDFKARALERGIELVEPNYEGVRLNFGHGWALLRMSLHDPIMPLNVESAEDGGSNRIVDTLKELLRGFDHLDVSTL